MHWEVVEAIGTWFGGLATAGSFFLGFQILRKDRKDRESEQARQVAVEMVPLMRSGGGSGRLHKLDIRVWNNSVQPISLVAMRTRGGGPYWPFLMEREGSTDPDWVLLPGEMARETKVDHPEWEDAKSVIVTFRDQHGIEWKYDPSTRELSRLKYRRMRRQREDGSIARVRVPILQ